MKTNKIVTGILAHVDSGKTTLAESMLYLSGRIRKFGRVDHKDTFFDNDALERVRGITIFSKQAQFCLKDKEICLLDTPGHVDFGAEMERTLQVLDYAILVISAADGVQGHTITLWQLLKRYRIPVFLFINKMDRDGADKDWILNELQKKLDACCVDFSVQDQAVFMESLAMCSEEALEFFLENGSISDSEIVKMVEERQVFPCFFGSALKQEGVREFLDAMDTYMKPKSYPDIFSARVFKIARDEQNNRLTYMKIMGGVLRTKDLLGEGEKADQIRIYAGNHFVAVNEACAGTVCAVTGLTKTVSGAGIGALEGNHIPLLEPVLSYGIEVPKDCNIHDFYLKMCSLCEEYPELNVVWNEKLGQIQAKVMGAVQLEVLKHIIFNRFGVLVSFGTGNIVYKETIVSSVTGIGHFEPLRHYAEVHLLIEPLARGSGLEFAADCSEAVLDKNWQRLILTHLEEKRHVGVLTGSEITDMRITLVAGRAHQKHTEGGDFRQATYRAVRQGLKSAQCVLLEPVYVFRLEIPSDCVGRALSDIQKRNGSFEGPVIEQDRAVITGRAPAVLMQDYQLEVASYSKGLGQFSCSLCGYDLCHNEAEIVQRIGYDSENDLDNPTGSIFCSHGAGYYVTWNEVAAYAHVDNEMSERKTENDYNSQISKGSVSAFGDLFIAQEEIDEIFERTFGSIKKKRNNWGRRVVAQADNTYKGTEHAGSYEGEKEYLLVDGYNIIFAWEELRNLSEVNIDSARDKLMDIMCNYQGYKNVELILVFDAYKVHGGQGTAFDYHNIHVVYTKEAETADQYIEKFAHDVGKKYRVTVATSDRLEQMIVWGAGAKRLSAQGLWEEVAQINREIREYIEGIK